MSDSRPLGFFDSGLGGLTVLKTVRARFPDENFLYLGDTARLPYGSKSPETIRRYTEQSLRALFAHDVKAIVVACNSASTALLNSKEIEASSKIPIYNVIEPGAAIAVETSKTKRIGVLGTRATVGSLAYPKAISALAPTATVFQQAAPLLVPLVEEGWETDPLTNLVIYRYVAPLVAASIDTLILGCTHYPALREGIARVTGAGITLVDSAQVIAQNLERDFDDGKILRCRENKKNTVQLFATDTSPAMDQTAQRLMADINLPPFQMCDL